MLTDLPPRGLTPRELARQLRVSAEKIRNWISKGEIAAVNTADPGGRPRWIVLPEQLASFLAARQAKPPAKPAPRRRRQTAMVDYFPD